MRHIRTSGSMSGVWKRKQGGASEAPRGVRPEPRKASNPARFAVNDYSLGSPPLSRLTRIANSQHCTSLPSREVSRPLSASVESQKLRVNQSLSVGYLDFPCHSPGRGRAGLMGIIRALTRREILSLRVRPTRRRCHYLLMCSTTSRFSWE